MKKKKKKQNLMPISINSFHTSLSEEEKYTIDGGGQITTSQNPRPASPPNSPALITNFWDVSIPPGACPEVDPNTPHFRAAERNPCGASACMSAPGDHLATCTHNSIQIVPLPEPTDNCPTDHCTHVIPCHTYGGELTC